MQRFNIFRDQSIQLAMSLIFKSEAIAEQMNLAITENGGYVSNDRTTWRYYLHLAGRRHEIDKPILFKSVESGEEIELTVANLAIHKKTSNVYRSNTEYIENLIATYPDYAVYIKGVFWPVSLERAISLDDCSIMYYDLKYVETQEQSLIHDLEAKIRATHVRYFAQGWRVHNDAFVLAFYDMLYPMLPAFIMQLRQEKQFTVETHSYYVTEFLASHQELHEFIPYLTQKQMFTLYRNIRYWERNSGKKEIFDWMVETLLTGWSMPAVAYNVGQLIHDPTTGSDDDLTPKPTGYQQALNYTERTSGRDLDLVATADLIQKELSLASENSQHQVEYQTDLDTRLGLTQYPNLSTKLVEVTAIDPEAIERWEYMHGLFNEWLHLTASGKYNIYHDILNPTNGDTLKLSSKELFALYLYAGFKGFSNIELTTIPAFHAMGVQIKRWITPEEMHNAIYPESWVGRYDGMVNYFADTQYEVIGTLTSNDELFDAVSTMLDNKRKRYSYVYNRRKIPDRAAGLQLFTYMYRSYRCDLALPYTDYEEFFRTYGIDHTLISNETWQDIATDAFNIATNMENRAVLSQGEIQRAMVRLMSKLSSYTIHFAARMASDSYDITDPITPILGDIPASAHASMSVDHPHTGVQDVAVKSKMTTSTPLAVMPDIVALKAPRRLRYQMDIAMGIQVTMHQHQVVNISEPLVGVDVTENVKDKAYLSDKIGKRALDGFIKGEYF